MFSGQVSTRIVVEDTLIAGKVFKKGGTVMLPVRTQHMSRAVWGDDVDSFVPDRFLQHSTPTTNERSLAKDKERWLRPFGGGNSLCPGRFFAQYEILSMVASLIWRYDMEVVPGQKLPTANLKALNVGIVAPTHDPRVRISPRKFPLY